MGFADLSIAEAMAGLPVEEVLALCDQLGCLKPAILVWHWRCKGNYLNFVSKTSLRYSRCLGSISQSADRAFIARALSILKEKF